MFGVLLRLLLLAILHLSNDCLFDYSNSLLI